MKKSVYGKRWPTTFVPRRNDPFTKLATVIEIRKEMYFKKSKTFAFELSDVDLHGYQGSMVCLKNPKTGNKMMFRFTKADMDSTNEDTYGWNYRSVDDQFNLLIIND
jgi:hypothetical protein